MAGPRAEATERELGACATWERPWLVAGNAAVASHTVLLLYWKLEVGLGTHLSKHQTLMLSGLVDKREF